MHQSSRHAATTSLEGDAASMRLSRKSDYEGCLCRRRCAVAHGGCSPKTRRSGALEKNRQRSVLLEHSGLLGSIRALG